MRPSKKHNSHIIRYGVIVTFFIRVLLLGYVYYEYLVSKTDKAPTKGGTLIEGVTSNVSYVPYTSNSPQDSFYQHLLFKGCQSYMSSGAQVSYEEELCSVISNDNKTYVVSIVDTGTWSDGAPINIDDLVFTYQDILQKNIWDLGHGKSYDNLNIQKISNNSLSITFPRSSKDNLQFFTFPILPSHILANKDVQRYRDHFSVSPITNGCVKLSNSRDANSLIFDVGGCKGTWLKYYQVKNVSWEDIKEDPGIVDMYIGDQTVPSYKTGTVVSNDYVGVFFNMQKGKLSIYGRKNVIALLNKYIYAPENGVPIIKEHFLFDEYPTAVSDKSAITMITTGAYLDPAPALPSELTLSPENKDQIYSLAAFENSQEIVIRFPGDKPTSVINNYGAAIPLTKKGSSYTITLLNNMNILPGLNTLTFKDGVNTLGTIDVYYQTVHSLPKHQRVHVLYYTQDKVHNHIAETMKNVVTQEGLADYFYFDGINNADEYLAKLSSKEYDITIQTLALGFKKDISALFLVNNPINNPSLYVNANLANQINDYFQSPLITQYSIKPIITKLYTTDLPFFIVGKRIGYVNLKPSLTLPPQSRRDDASVRMKIFHDIVVVYKPQITRKDMLDRKRFSSFILSELGL